MQSPSSQRSIEHYVLCQEHRATTTQKMPGDVENGPLLDDEKFSSLIMAVQEQGDGDRLIPMERRHIKIEITSPYMAIIQYYFDSHFHQVRLR